VDSRNEKKANTSCAITLLSLNVSAVEGRSDGGATTINAPSELGLEAQAHPLIRQQSRNMEAGSLTGNIEMDLDVNPGPSIIKSPTVLQKQVKYILSSLKSIHFEVKA
jgi:hypothetical protein